jgi:hypothetical protein
VLIVHLPYNASDFFKVKRSRSEFEVFDYLFISTFNFIEYGYFVGESSDLLVITAHVCKESRIHHKGP